MPLLINLAPNAFLLYFHQHRGENECNSCVFINIVERRKTDIFSTLVFNDIARLSFHFLIPFFFVTLAADNPTNYVIFNKIDFFTVFAIHC